MMKSHQFGVDSLLTVVSGIAVSLGAGLISSIRIQNDAIPLVSTGIPVIAGVMCPYVVPLIVAAFVVGRRTCGMRTLAALALLEGTAMLIQSWSMSFVQRD
jgi:hypothetical protein